MAVSTIWNQQPCKAGKRFGVKGDLEHGTENEARPALSPLRGNRRIQGLGRLGGLSFRLSRELWPGGSGNVSNMESKPKIGTRASTDRFVDTEY
jgi:hypothetical protein